MRNNDTPTREELRGQLQQALSDNDAGKYAQVFDQMLDRIREDVQEEYEQRLQEIENKNDSVIMQTRGVRPLTSGETKYYTQLINAMKSRSPQQALADVELVMPQTVIDSVFEDLRTRHELLNAIDFTPTNGAIEMLMNKNGYQEAAWGELCDEIIEELASGFKVVDTTLLKLSAFILVCKAQLDLGPVWLDRYVREVLYEALANGLEKGIVDGDGNSQPIGMTRQVGEDVTVTGGKYPRKAAIKVNSLSVATVGGLIAKLAMNENGQSRTVDDLLLLVNPQDYYEKVMPATTAMAPDGSYRNNITPYPMRIIPVAALNRGYAVFGMAKRYFAAAGMGKEGRIEYSDHAKFLQDKRVYLIKLYANGMPKDNNAFLYLDISDLKPLVWKAELVEGGTPSNDATLSALSLGSAALSPAFNAATLTYTAATTNASNTINAVPADADAAIKVAVNGTEINNGSAATWQEGSNTVEITVTAADGSTKSYTVTVTKS